MTAGGRRNGACALGRRCGVCLSVLLASSAYGQPAADQAVFVVQVAADQQERAALREILRDAVARQNVALQIVPVERIDPSAVIRRPAAPPSRPPLGRAFLDLADASVVTVYIVDGTRERILVRHLLRTSNPDVAREAVGRIVSTAVEALLAGSFVQNSDPMAEFVLPPAKNRSGESPATEEAEPPRPEQAALPPPEQVRAPQLEQSQPPHVVRSLGQWRRDVFSTVASEVGAAYEAQLVAPGTLAHGPELYGELALGKGAVRPVVWLTGQYRWPVSVDTPPIGFRMDTIALRALAGAQIDLPHHVTLEAGAGVGVDIVDLEPQRATGDQSVWLAGKRSFVVGLGRAMVAARRRLASFLSVRVALLADVDGSRTRFLFQDGQGTQEVLAWYGIRPGLSLSISVP